MEEGKEYTKDEVINFLAKIGLVYSGLDKHLDEWFENYYMNYGFECIGDDLYLYHEDEW